MDKPRHSQNIGTEESVETKRLLHGQHQNEEDLQDQRTQVDQPTQSSEPQRILLWAMLFYGMGALLPCGVILTDMDFFISSLPTHHPEFVYNTVINISMVFAQTLGVKLTMKQSYLVKLETVLFPLIILMISFPIIIQYVSDNVAWTVSIFLLVLIGFGIGLTTSYTAAIAGMLGPQFIGPLMQGYSFGFVVVGLLRLICLLAFNGQDQSDYFKGTILYFSLNTVILTVMALSIPIFLKQDYIKLHLKIQSKEEDVDDIQKSSLSNAKFDTKATTMKIWLEATTIFVTFLLSYMLYPSILYQKQQVLVEGRADWSIFIINMSFALSDLIGRTAAKLKQSYSRPLLIASMIVRLLFIASSFLIALSDAPFWNSPATVIINAMLLGFTNGFFATAACNTIPGMLENNEKEFGGFVMSVMINGGIAIGSIISLVGFSGIFEK